MTTNPAPAQRAPRVLLAGVLWVLGSTAVATLAGALAQGRTEALSALLGGAIVLVFFGFGAVVVGSASQLAPHLALLVAMLTYTFQVALVALVFAGLTRADAFDSSLTAGWLAGALIAGTFAWMAGQLIATFRAPIPPWEGRPEDPSAAAADADLEAAVPGREAGA